MGKTDTSSVIYVHGRLERGRPRLRKTTGMRLTRNRRGSVGLLICLLVGAALLIAGCGGDEEQAVAQAVGTQAQQQVAGQTAGQGAEGGEAAATSQSVSQAEEEPEAQRDSAAASSAGQAQEEDGASAAADATAEQSEEEDRSADATEQAAAQEGQEDAQAQATEAQQGEEVGEAARESVAEGTRLITLFGDLTEIVYALGIEEYLVARDTSSVYPAATEDLPNLGFAGALNAEAILALEPTLVIGTDMAGPPGVLEQLREAGVEVVVLDELNGLDAAQIKIRVVGEALGIPETAEALALDVEQRLAAVTAEAAEFERPLRVLHVYVRRGGVQLVSGAGNKAEAIIEAAGGIDAAAEVGIEGWQPLTPEALVAIDPEVYLVMDLGLAVVGGIEGLLEIPGMAETQAGRARRVISMPDLYLLGFGPRLPEAIADLTAYLRVVEAEIRSE